MADPTSSMPPPPAAGFQSASSLLKTQNTNSPSTSSGSLRNASGGQPPIPIPEPDLPGPSSAPINGNGTTAQAQAGPSTSRPINRPAAGKNSIIYNSVQKRNPVLGSIKNVSVEIGDIVADYQVGAHNGVLFLSLKYHRLHPEYIHQRIEKMKGNYNLRIILVLCDVAEHQQSLRELNKIAIINEYTVFVAWSNDEIAQYLTCFKSFEHKSADSLKERIQQTYHDQLQHVLTSGRKVNKTDADNLAAQFGSFANISRQPSKILSNVKGLGATKVTSLVDAFNKPFLVGGLKTTTDTTSLRTEGGSNSNEKTSEDIGSPDWPADEEEEEEQGEEEEAIPGSRRGRRRSPSRSPGLSPEPRDQDVWQDPLDQEDEDGEPSSKRVRVD
ncbi:DNA excision repair protein ERCC-1 [Kwoniella mangroviensis CBS 10435]|uniref:DNA excision repair protein ERCC-1 n=1 Tax=Kwoniella mangroviensis CBS 10435 TaxID=1331196 RepID=A0A1B9ILN5_9TREE|nr:DNA excision repair protein ERCC-1 [Kwoniella mangroviensis CBS 10435]